MSDDVRQACICSLDGERDRKGNDVYRLGRVPPVPDRYSVVLGDAVHNYRAALDHLAIHLLEAGGGTAGRRTQFPILDERRPTAKLPDIWPTVESAVRVALDVVQPYHHRSPRTHDLSILHALDIGDKHRELRVSVVGLQSVGWFGERKVVSWNPGPYQPGDKVCSFKASPNAPPLEPTTTHPHFAVLVVHPRAGGLALTMDIATFLDQSVRTYIVDKVITPLSTFL